MAVGWGYEMAEAIGRIVDAHIHVWPADRERYPLSPGFEEPDMWIPSYEAKDHLAMAGPHGVGRINFVQMTWYGTDHSYILDLIAAEPDRFVGTGIVPAVTDIDVGSPSRQMSALARGGVYAFRVRGGSARPGLLGAGPRWLDHPGYHEMFEAGARENLAISFLMDPVDIPEVDRMCGLYPDTPVIVDHLCRIGADGEFREEDIAAFCGLAKHRGVLVKVGPFNHLGAKVKPYLDVLPLVERTIDAFGPERCMWESDSPALRPGNYDADPPADFEAGLVLVRDHAGLSPSDRDHLLFGTAERFFFDGRPRPERR